VVEHRELPGVIRQLTTRRHRSLRHVGSGHRPRFPRDTPSSRTSPSTVARPARS
jgi:hypothetical protein